MQTWSNEIYYTADRRRGPKARQRAENRQLDAVIDHVGAVQQQGSRWQCRSRILRVPFSRRAEAVAVPTNSSLVERRGLRGKTVAQQRRLLSIP